MSQRISNSFVNTNRPGSYFEQVVKSTPIGIASSGNIIIFGEADGGAAVYGIDSVDGDVLKDNYFTPDQLGVVVSKYVSGPVVDAFRQLTSPSSDANIVGSANRIFIAKTNKSSKASAPVAATYGTLSDKNFGKNGNKYKYQILQSKEEVAPSVTSDVVAAFGVTLDEAEFKIRKLGGAEVTVTLSATPADHADIATLIVELNTLLTAQGFTVTAGTAANTYVITQNEDLNAHKNGYGKSFEIVEGADLAALGLDAGVYTSSQEPEVQVDIVRQDTGTNESFLVASEVVLTIGYEGTTATMTIEDGVLTTAVTGGSGSALSINLSEFKVLTDLADYIKSQTGYSCSVVPSFSQLSPSKLDEVTALGVCSSTSLEVGRVKASAWEFQRKLSASNVLDFEATATKGLADETTGFIFLSGGAKGGTVAADVAKAVTDMESVDANFVVPLFSQNASLDIADGLTESSSTYTIDAIHALVKNHVLKMSTVKIKKHRSAFLSYWGQYSEIKAKAGSLANARISMCFQKASQVNSVGEVVNYMPWFVAVSAAGMQAAGFYKAIVNKQINVISYTDPAGFDSGSYGNIEDALDSGLLFLEKRISGNFWVSDQTTYGVDTNFVYNSVSSVYSADLVSLDLAASFHNAFVGKSLADVDAGSAIAFLGSKMDGYRRNKLISSSSDAPLGYKNASVKINGPILEVSVEIKISTALYFIPITIEISQITG